MKEYFTERNILCPERLLISSERKFIDTFKLEQEVSTYQTLVNNPIGALGQCFSISLDLCPWNKMKAFML